MTWRRALLVLVSVAVVATTSCGGPGGSSEEDARRVELLLADPALEVEPDGAELVNARTHEASSSFLGGDQNEVERVFDVADPHSFVIEVTTAVIEAGWSINPERGIQCASNGSIDVVGTRVIDGLAATARVFVVPVGSGDEWRGTLALSMASGTATPFRPDLQGLGTEELAESCIGE